MKKLVYLNWSLVIMLFLHHIPLLPNNGIVIDALDKKVRNKVSTYTWRFVLAVSRFVVGSGVTRT